MNYSKRLVLLTLLLALLLLAVWLLSSPVRTALLECCLPQFVSTTSEKKEEMVTNNLLKLSRAIAEFEGWDYSDAKIKNDFVGTKSWRNHNPGNLRRSPWAIGTKDNFAVFINDDVGFSALIWDLHQKAIGNTITGLNGQSTIYQLIEKYSAEPPEIVLNYALFIEKRTGLKMTTKIGDLIK